MKPQLWLLCSLLVISSFESTFGQFSNRVLEKRILDNILQNYDARIRPNSYANESTLESDKRPITDTINMFVRDVERIDDSRNEYTIQLTFRQRWSDARLNYDGQSKIKYISLIDPKLIWTPDIFFSNSRSGVKHGVLNDNHLIRIFPNGEVLYSTRISLTLGCKMDLHSFPFDSQICEIKFASYGYNDEDLILEFKPEVPIQVKKHLDISDFVITSVGTDYCTARTNTGTYSCLLVKFQFDRRWGHHLTQTFIPIITLVIVSYLSFMVQAVALRFTLSLASFGGAFALISFTNGKFPVTPYTRSIDVFTGVSLTFLLGTLLLHVWMDYAASQSRTRSTPSSPSPCPPKDLESQEPLVNGKNADPNLIELITVSNKKKDRSSSPPRSMSRRMNTWTRIIYPSLYVAFVLIYTLYHVSTAPTMMLAESLESSSSTYITSSSSSSSSSPSPSMSSSPSPSLSITGSSD